MRNFLARHFHQACFSLSNRITEGVTHYTPDDYYLADGMTATLLLHPPDADPRSLVIWATGKLFGIKVNPLHCSLLIHGHNGIPLYIDFTMDGVSIVNQPYRAVVGYMIFGMDEVRRQSIIRRLLTFFTLALKINPLAAYPFITGGVPKAIVCTSFVRWLLYHAPGYVSIDKLCDVVFDREEVIKYEGIRETRSVSKM